MDTEMWYMYTMEHNSDIKKNKIPFSGKWMEMEIIMFGEISQS
jgi:hypothetical protein